MKKAETVATATQETEVKDVTSTVNNATAATAIKDAEKVVKAAKAPKPRKPNVEIVSAFYGIEGTEVDFKATCKIGQKLTNKMVTTDPVPKKVKSATIVITVDGEKRTATFTENEKILFEEFKPEVKEEIVTQE